MRPKIKEGVEFTTEVFIRDYPEFRTMKDQADRISDLAFKISHLHMCREQGLGRKKHASDCIRWFKENIKESCEELLKTIEEVK